MALQSKMALQIYVSSYSHQFFYSTVHNKYKRSKFIKPIRVYDESNDTVKAIVKDLDAVCGRPLNHRLLRCGKSKSYY